MYLGKELTPHGVRVKCTKGEQIFIFLWKNLGMFFGICCLFIGETVQTALYDIVNVTVYAED